MTELECHGNLKIIFPKNRIKVGCISNRKKVRFFAAICDLAGREIFTGYGKTYKEAGKRAIECAQRSRVIRGGGGL